jgi:hypothetical protein
MNIGGGKEGVDAGMSRRLNSLPSSLDVLAPASRQGGDDGSSYLARHRLHGAKISLRRYRESRLDDVDAQAFKLVRHPQLFG